MDNLAVARHPSPVGAWTATAAIILYILLITGVRLGLSPFLEIDEAQFVGAVDLKLIYGNSHPPLYNWLVRGALELTGEHWTLAVTLVRGSLLMATYLLTFDAARRIAGPTAGILAVALMAFMPQVSWMSAHTLAHSILVMAAAAGLVNGVARLATGPRWSAFLVLGLSAGVGALAKPNIWILVFTLILAMLTDRFWWRRLATAWAFLVPVIVGVMAGPAMWAMAHALRSSTERIEKLYRDGPFSAIDLPGVGVDGVVSLVVALLASVGVVLALVALFGRARPVLSEEGDAVRRLLWRTLALSLGLSAVAVLAADMSSVHERYLTPILMPLPVVASLHLLAWRPWRIIGVAAAVFLAVPIGIAAMTAFDDHRFARPYDALAAQILAETPPGRITVSASRQSLEANMMIAFRRAGREAWVTEDRHAPMTDVAIAMQPGTGKAVPPPEGHCTGKELTVSAPMHNVMGRPMPVRATIATRCKR
ncbi:hypothetical protein DLJ53_04570 [Acuticoccus sediminis]|uniref:Glycosyltransferase RgtA/B/C/D-like domain-containing protein n=1 Tax=Acuticoccus sediminis TaxID=2184697 RepID=A0A8B2NZX8_9HYPH|nr:glycosyltransferase family 39 protein [Acuticoccus sediminis]RAI03755.1 hypothetical protein DLJ53_04570 [Acuticoccus sediminis]